MPATRRPTRRLPLDDLTPLSFVTADGIWPSGPFGTPWTADDVRRMDMTEMEVELYVRAVTRLGRTVIDYRKWLAGENMTQATFARRIGVSEGRLSALRSGTRFPSWDLVERIRVVIAPPPKAAGR